jgi:formate dehydrogenase major subunit
VFDAAHAGTLKAMYVLGGGIAQSDPTRRTSSARLEELNSRMYRTSSCETAKYAHVVLPGPTFLKDGAHELGSPHPARAPGVKPPPGRMTDGDVISRVARAMGVDFGFDDGPGTDIGASRIMDEDPHR